MHKDPAHNPIRSGKPLALQGEAAVTPQELQALIGAMAGDPVGALSALSAHAKKQAAREAIDRLLADRSPVYAALNGVEPKARKNAARLLGALARERDATALIKALRAEETRFVVPSLLLALGSVGGAQAKAALEAYAPPAAADEAERKHAEEIALAHQKALAALARDLPLPERKKLDTVREILAAAPAGFAPVLQRELAALGFSGALETNGVLVQTDDLARLYRARCMAEALLPAGQNIALDPGSIAAAATGRLSAPYRIELKHYMGDRAAFIRALASALGGGDNPSRYIDELRVVCTGADRCDVFIKPCNVPDHRFDYRKKAISASIAPSTAACLARYALSFVPAGHIFALDPFCGSGTLLFELEQAAPGCTALGVDVSSIALSAAQENARAAKSRARFVRKDILRFEPKSAFDLVLTNMPFGNRVGSHEANDPLYRGFIRLLPRLLSPGGIALLYTMEHKLLLNCLKNEPGLTIAAELTTEAGGLNPRVTIVRKKQ
ncbi:MAG: methyltransferase domain-containing protein [Clostridiales bacterium]|nr:methyltransferase domain-containing protein [Clostridiales bacterium]